MINVRTAEVSIASHLCTVLGSPLFAGGDIESEMYLIMEGNARVLGVYLDCLDNDLTEVFVLEFGEGIWEACEIVHVFSKRDMISLFKGVPMKKSYSDGTIAGFAAINADLTWVDNPEVIWSQLLEEEVELEEDLVEFDTEVVSEEILDLGFGIPHIVTQSKLVDTPITLACMMDGEDSSVVAIEKMLDGTAEDLVQPILQGRDVLFEARLASAFANDDDDLNWIEDATREEQWDGYSDEIYD